MNPYYQDERVTLYHGDCLEVLDNLEPHSSDTLVTDPPYFLPSAHYSVRSGQFRSLSDLSMLEHFFRDVFGLINRVLKLTATGYVFCDGQSYPAFYAVGYGIFHRLRPLVWDKVTSINGYDWRHQHELILYFTKALAPQTPTGDGDIIRARAVPIGERDHLAQKPVELMEKLVRQTGPPGGLVLDPFAGSGSTLLAAAISGRQAIGVEADERYCEIAAERAATAPPPLDFSGGALPEAALDFEATA